MFPGRTPLFRFLPSVQFALALALGPALPLAAAAQDAARNRPSGAAVSLSAAVGTTNSMDVLDDKRKLVIGDRLSYRVVEERTQPYPLFVTDSGEIEVPLIGRVPAAGRTCKQLARAIKSELEKEYFYRATVIVGLDAASARSGGRIYLSGQIRSQGSMEIPPGGGFTLSKAILQAGGFADFANQRKVKIVRKSGDGGASETFTVDVADILKGRTEKDVVLQPEDVVIVPERLVNF